MASVLVSLRNVYYEDEAYKILENIQNLSLFEQDCIVRMGKQYISILISASMLKAKVQGCNRDITMALKRAEEDLMVKMRLSSKKEVYKIFGKFLFNQLENIPDFQMLQIELALIYFKNLEIYQEETKSLAKFRPLPSIKSSCQTVTTGLSSIRQSTSDSMKTKNSAKIVMSNPAERRHTALQEVLQQNELKKPSNNRSNDRKSTQSDEQRSQKGDQNEQSFNFDLTEKDAQVESRDVCEQFFINLVAYLKNLSSPQGELTYITQHLKWQGFQTVYEPYLNQRHEWVCTAKIYFPANMATPDRKLLERTQTSRNKKKARQLACMDLLKSLYLEYPETWMRYKHLKEEKKLTIAPMEEPKDDDQLAIITNRNNYFINKQKIYNLFNYIKTDVRQMMTKISAKAELNTLLQQLPGRVTSPKLEKKMMDGFWSVPVRIQYRTEDHIENRIAPKVYEKTVIDQNAKIAEEEAYMQALIELYEQNPLLLEKIQSIKLAKNIKDAEKKLPVLTVSHVSVQTASFKITLI